MPAILIAVPVRETPAQEWPIAKLVDQQPLRSQVQRVLDAMVHVGSPLPDSVRAMLLEEEGTASDAEYARKVQELLDPFCFAAVVLQGEGRPSVVSRFPETSIDEQGWKTFLIKVVNQTETRSRLRIDSPNAKPIPHSLPEEVASRWLGLSMFDGQPLTPSLSGFPLEYRILEIYSAVEGERPARIEFSAPVAKAFGANRQNSIVADWRFDKGNSDWVPANQIELTTEAGQLVLRGTGDDAFMTTVLPDSVEPGSYILRFWGNSEEDGVGQVFWWTDERPAPDGDHAVSFNVERGREKMYEIPIRETGHLKGLRIDPNGKPCHWVMDWIELANTDRGSDWGGADFVLRTVPSTQVTFRVIDDPDRPPMASFEIMDSTGRIYPPQTKRIAPDFFFQRQIYRAMGESVRLPAGKYTVRCSRGPETIPEVKELIVGDSPVELEYCVRR